jgi:tetratricopeptide (TPR) repeat protein
MYEQAQHIKPSDTTAYVYAAYAAEAFGDRELQLKNAHKLLSLNHKSLYTYSNVATDALENKNYPEAFSLLDKALKEFPLHKHLLHLYTQTYLESGKVDEGIAFLEQQLKESPYNVDVLTNLSILYTAKKDNDAVLLTYNKIIAIEPYNFVANFNSAVLNFEKGKELAKKNDKKGAEAMFQKSLEHAKRAKSLASEDNDVDNLQRLINELNIILGK